MKTANSVILTVLSVLALQICQAQNKKADKLYEKGVEAYNSENCRAADSLFGLSAEMQPNKDVYYNLAIVKNKLGDQCESCRYLKLAGNLGDDKAYELFKKHCIVNDTINYINHSFYCLTEKLYCHDSIYSFSFFKKAVIGKDSIVLLKADSSLSDKKYASESFDVENYIDTVVISLNEISPEYPGGEDALMEFLARNIKYPMYAKENNIQGNVYVTFVVEPDGKISTIKILRGIGGGCDEEAMRVIGLMPPWKPGSQLGKPVRVQFNFPIRFIINEPMY